LLRAACLLHHHDISLLLPRGPERPLVGIPGSSPPAVTENGRLASAVRGVLDAFNVPGTGKATEQKLTSILWLADAFDEHMKMPPNGADEVGEILERLRDGVETGLWPVESIDALVHSTSATLLGRGRLPVFPQAALRALSLMRDPRACLADVIESAKRDPSIAGLVMQLANSALFASRTPIATLANAINRLGFAIAQKVITAAAMRPLFSSSELQEVWHHSLEAADLSEQLADRSGTIDPAEAYLAGLLHDVGRIALLAMPLYDSARLQGLLHGGCPRVYAEHLVLRTDHAAVGAEIAEGWRLRETMVLAIRQHHRPERAGGPLSCLLYVVEYLSGTEEDLSSRSRLESALRGIGLTWDKIRDCTVSALGSWLAAA